MSSFRTSSLPSTRSLQWFGNTANAAGNARPSLEEVGMEDLTSRSTSPRITGTGILSAAAGRNCHFVLEKRKKGVLFFDEKALIARHSGRKQNKEHSFSPEKSPFYIQKVFSPSTLLCTIFNLQYNKYDIVSNKKLIRKK